MTFLSGFPMLLDQERRGKIVEGGPRGNYYGPWLVHS